MAMMICRLFLLSQNEVKKKQKNGNNSAKKKQKKKYVRFCGHNKIAHITNPILKYAFKLPKFFVPK